MRHRSARRGEQPSSRAELTVSAKLLPPHDPAESEPTPRAAIKIQPMPPYDLGELPTLSAELTIQVCPLPSSDLTQSS